LPVPLERIRQVASPPAAGGCPAHVTLLYPFVVPPLVDAETADGLGRVIGAHRSFRFELASVKAWPDTVYLAPEPREPFDALYRSLQAALAGWPIYGGAFSCEPHVSVAQVPNRLDLSAAASELEAWLRRTRDTADGLLPVPCDATKCLLIAQD